MADKLEPGSEWLLPVTYDFSLPGVWHHFDILHERLRSSVTLQSAQISALIPAHRLTDLEAEVARLQARVDELEDELTDIHKGYA